MKKILAAALTASFVLMTAGSALAAQPEFNGSIQYQHRFNKVDSSSSDENRLKFVLNGHADAIAKNMNLYFRISAEKLGGSTQTARSFNSFTGQGDEATSAVGFFDQFGVEIKNAGWNYKVGRQDAFIGANGLIYDSTYGIGRHIFADGVTVTGKSGVTNLTAVALQLDQYTDDDSKLYALAASYNPTKKLTLGATLAKYNRGNGPNDVTEDANFWDVNTAYTFNRKLDGYAEYAKSNLDIDNTAYVLGLNYSLDKKNFLWTCYSHVEKNGNIHDGMSTTTYDHNRKGMWYGFGHKFDKTTSFAIFYSDMKKIDPAAGPRPGSKNHKSLRTTVNYKF